MFLIYSNLLFHSQANTIKTPIKFHLYIVPVNIILFSIQNLCNYLEFNLLTQYSITFIAHMCYLICVLQ